MCMRLLLLSLSGAVGVSSVSEYVHVQDRAFAPLGLLLVQACSVANRCVCCRKFV